MKTGIELIAKERQEQIEKHRRTVQSDVDNNADSQLAYVASVLSFPYSYTVDNSGDEPKGWDRAQFLRMYRKSTVDRLIIAGALIAAEIDRINFIDPPISQPLIPLNKPVNNDAVLDFQGTEEIIKASFKCLQCAVGQDMNTNCAYILSKIGNSIQVCSNCGYDNYFDIRPLILKTRSNEQS